MANQASVLRLAAEGRLLAGFLSEDLASGVPQFAQASTVVQNAVRTKFGLASTRSGPFGPPRFRHVDEPEAIEVLKVVALQVGGTPALNNLIGFEWIDIGSIVAGHYVASPMPLRDRTPSVDTPISELARFCLVGGRIEQDLVVSQNGELIAPERLRLRLGGLSSGPGTIAPQYVVDQEPFPITVMLLENQVVAIRQQERLVALFEAGIKEALCLVAYGYGLEVLSSLPTIDSALLFSQRPPLISDFSDEELMLRVPVPTPRTMITFSHQVIDLSRIQ